ncbi:S-layer homology domain-containing protein [Thiolapillus sp.]
MTLRKTFKRHRLLLATLIALTVNSGQAEDLTGGGQPAAEGSLSTAVSDTLSADIPWTDMAPASYGTSDISISVIPWLSFVPRDSSHSFTNGPGTNRRCPTGASAWLYAPLPDDIPDGAQITQIAYYIRDNDAANDFLGNVLAYYADSNSGANWSYTQTFNTTVNPSGTPGDSIAYGPASFVVDRRQDINNNGYIDVVSYVIQARLATTGDLCIAQARVLWKRQVSPAPATATFSDVPTSHQFFQYVEALADSGITSGCSASQYCPDDPVTRGQMAVFLSRALGLHWPAF